MATAAFYISVFGAVLAILVGLRQLWLDVAHVKIQFTPGAILPRFGSIAGGRSGTVVRVANTGRGPITIMQIVQIRPEWLQLPPAWILPTNSAIDPPAPPFTLQQAEWRVGIVENGTHEFPRRAVFVAEDQAGRWWPRRRFLRVWMAGLRIDYKLHRSWWRVLRKRIGGFWTPR